jgi:putative membrane protein
MTTDPHSGISMTDRLAMERTRLANERTFLAYLRSFIVFLSSGFAILKIELLDEIVLLGYFLISVAAILLIIGIIRFQYYKRKLRQYFR